MDTDRAEIGVEAGFHPSAHAGLQGLTGRVQCIVNRGRHGAWVIVLPGSAAHERNRMDVRLALGREAGKEPLSRAAGHVVTPLPMPFGRIANEPGSSKTSPAFRMFGESGNELMPAFLAPLSTFLVSAGAPFTLVSRSCIA